MGAAAAAHEAIRLTTHFGKLLDRARRADGTLDIERLERSVAREFKRNLAAIAVEKMRMNAAIDSTGHAISIYDRHHRLVHCNAEFLRLYHLPKRLGRKGTTFEEILRGRVAGGSHIGEDTDSYVRERLEFVARRVTQTDVLTLNSGTLIRQKKERDSPAGMSNARSASASPSAASMAFVVRASVKVSRTLPDCRVGDWLLTFTANSITSPSRRNRGGFGCTIRSFAVTTSPCR